jgi:hypothetical protein
LVLSTAHRNVVLGVNPESVTEWSVLSDESSGVVVVSPGPYSTWDVLGRSVVQLMTAPTGVTFALMFEMLGAARFRTWTVISVEVPRSP